jgi:hypothetical protein
MRRSARLAALVGALLAGCGGSTPATHWLIYRDAQHGFSVRYPADWERAPRSLTPHLVDPREILTVGTGPLPSGGRCAQFPTRALQALGRDGVLVTIQERAAPGGAARRPSKLTLADGVVSEAVACAPGSRFGNRLFNFTAGGRTFDALIAFGPASSTRARSQALHVLDTFRTLPGNRSRPTPIALESALLANPNQPATVAICNRATATDRRRAPFGHTRLPLYACRIALRGARAERFDVQVLPNGCFVAERRRRGQADYGCLPRG